MGLAATSPQMRRTEMATFVDEWMDMPSIRLIYPEIKTVTPNFIFGWAADAYANGEIPHAPHTLEEAISLLSDAGHITVTTGVFEAP
jgi:hypothetical protein